MRASAARTSAELVGSVSPPELRAGVRQAPPGQHRTQIDLAPPHSYLRYSACNNLAMVCSCMLLVPS
jgi:hypothetical protein